ncbi:MAG: PCP reductase family protein [candidate division NC10 bacterium]|nr:PCP reductase family protein [candidate division NC10 bacterium]
MVQGIEWTEEALQRVENAPAFVRPGIYKLMAKRARERGRTIITSEFLTEIRNESMLRVAKAIRGFGFEELRMEAFDVAKEKMKKLPRKVEVIEAIKVFLGERTERNQMIIDKFTKYLKTVPEKGLPWTEEALARIQKVPPFVREMAKVAIEEEARRRKEKVVTPEVVEMVSRGASEGESQRAEGLLDGAALPWTAEAKERLRRIPIPFVRAKVIQKVEEYAQKRGLAVVDLPTYEAGLHRP